MKQKQKVNSGRNIWLILLALFLLFDPTHFPPVLFIDRLVLFRQWKLYYTKQIDQTYLLIKVAFARTFSAFPDQVGRRSKMMNDRCQTKGNRSNVQLMTGP